MEYGCIGEHLKHSFSKEIHALLADYDYEIKEIPKAELAAFMENKDFKAINVTIPYKLDVIPFLDEISDIAKAIGAVNTIVNKNGRLYGFNTDFYGMKALIEKSEVEIKGKKVLILGSGGTSKTAFAVAESLNASEIIRVSREKREGFKTYSEIYETEADADVIINTTPVGMYPNIEGSAVDIDKFPRLSGVIDAIYNPLRPELILKAKERGIKASGGLYMLVSQAVFAVEKFLDEKISTEKAEKTFFEVLKQKENIVLIGMPASGKTTVGKEIAKRLDRELVDTDDEIVKRAGMPITEIFERFGEAHFRELEKEVIAEIAANSCKVIATGGGAVLNSQNMSELRKNGRIYFLDRPLENLICTSDRPLSSSREALEKRYQERYDKYVLEADKRIEMTESIEENAIAIIEEFRRNEK